MLCRKCQTISIIDAVTGIKFKPECHDWNCSNGKRYLIKKWICRLNNFNGDYMLTLSTKYDFTFKGVKKANEVLTKFLAAMSYRKKFEYISVMGFDSLVHFHIIIKGTKPNKRWAKKKWHKLTGCYEIDLKERHANTDVYLIIDNASRLPNHKEGVYAWEGFGHSFKRIRTSKNLFPKNKQLKINNNDRYAIRICDEAEYLESITKTMQPTQQMRQ
jgi:hypothetical protein